jgi:hypothetical protein
MDFLRFLYLRLRYDPLFTFVAGALAAGLIQIASGNAIQRYGVLGILAAVVVVVLLWLAYRALLWLANKLMPPLRLPVGKLPTPRAGLIMLLGRNSDATGPVAMEQHRSRLEHVWVIATDFTAPLVGELRRKARPALLHQEDVVNHWEPPECNNAVQRAVSHAQVLGIGRDNLICDVTGGTSAMTAGALEACLALGLAAQMVAGRYGDAPGQVTPLGVIELDLSQPHQPIAPAQGG